MSNMEQMDEEEMTMMAIAMSLEGEKEEVFSIKGGQCPLGILKKSKHNRNDGNQS